MQLISVRAQYATREVDDCAVVIGVHARKELQLPGFGPEGLV